MRVGIYLHWAGGSGGGGGAEDMVLDEIKYNRGKADYFLFTEEEAGWSMTLDEFKSLDVPIFRLSVPDVDHYRQKYQEQQIDIVHVYACGDIQSGYQAAIDCTLPTVETAACVNYSAGWEHNPGRVQPVYLCRKHWEHGSGGKAEFKIITGGVDLEKLITETSKADCKRHFGLDPERPVVGWFGRFDQFKCPFSFADIARMVLDKEPRAQFIMFGDGIDKGRTEFLFKENKVPVKFTGFMREKALAFGCMDVYVMPTWQEAFGRVFVEAMACRVPIVTADYQVCREVCDGAAVYVPVARNDPMPLTYSKQYADLALMLLEVGELRDLMGTAGYNRARELYDAKRMAAEYLELYQHMTGKA